MKLEQSMHARREQLMEDIDCIIESNFGEVEYKDDVTKHLCDAVCKNFPDEEDSDWDETQRAAYNGLSSTDYHFPD